MKGYVRFVMNHKILLTVLLLVSIAIAGMGVRKIQLGSEFDVFTPNNSVYHDRLNEMMEDFPSSDQLMVLLEFDENELTYDTYETLVKFNQHVQDNIQDIRINGVVSDSDLSVISQVTYDMTIQRMTMLEELAPAVYREGKAYYTVTLFKDDVFVSDDIQTFEGYLEDEGITYAVSGDNYAQLKIFDYILFILTRIPPLAMVILFLVFYSQLRTIKGTILSVLPAAIGSLWTMGLIGYLGQEVSIITVLAPIFTLVIGSADGLHFITHVQEEQSEGKDTEELLTHTLHMVGVPMIITTITSMVGFLALMVMDTDAIISLAIFASVGIFLAGIATWYVLPLILSTGMQLGYKNKKSVEKAVGFKRFWGKPVWILIILVTSIFAVGGVRIQQEFNMLSIYKSYTDVYQYNEKIIDVNGGALPVFIYGDMPAGNQMAMMNEVTAFVEELRDLDEVGNAISAVDFIQKLGMNQTMMGGDNQMLSEFINLGAGKIRIMVFPVDLDNDTLKAIGNFVDSSNESYSKYDFKETGVGFMMMELNEGMIWNQVSSSILAVVVVFLLLLISLRHLRAALISIIPIVLTLLMLFGVMGLTGISLNLISCTIFSITIGVGIDYAIHFTSIWRLVVKDGLDGEAAANQAYRYTSRPIIANAFGLSLGFSALMLSPLQIHMTVSILMWIAMISSVLFSLIILPTFLRRVN